MPTQPGMCTARVYRGPWSTDNSCGRKAQKDGLCGLHLHLRDKRQQKDAEEADALAAIEAVRHRNREDAAPILALLERVGCTAGIANLSGNPSITIGRSQWDALTAALTTITTTPKENHA